MSRSGIDSYILYGVESVYKTVASSVATQFGIVQNVTPNKKNGLIQVRGMKGTTTGGRDLIKSLGGKVTASISIELQPQHFDWLQYVLGARTGAGTAGSNYVYTGSDTLDSLSIVDNFEHGTNDRTIIFLGCKANNCTIRGAIGEPITVTIEFLAATWNQAGTLETPVALDALDPYNFSGATAKLKAASGDSAQTLLEVVDGFEITITNNVEIIYGMGSREGQRALEKMREYSIKLTLNAENQDYTTTLTPKSWLDLMMGTVTTISNPVELSELHFVFVGDTNHTATFTFSAVTIDENVISGSLGEKVTEDLTLIAETLSVSEQQSA